MPKNPNFEQGLAIDKAPSEMNQEERLLAAKHALYETTRLLVGTRAALEYLAELVGVDEDELTEIGIQGERDEFRELEREVDEDNYRVGTYEEAEAEGYDHEEAARRILVGEPSQDFDEREWQTTRAEEASSE